MLAAGALSPLVFFYERYRFNLARLQTESERCLAVCE